MIAMFFEKRNRGPKVICHEVCRLLPFATRWADFYSSISRGRGTGAAPAPAPTEEAESPAEGPNEDVSPHLNASILQFREHLEIASFPRARLISHLSRHPNPPA